MRLLAAVKSAAGLAQHAFELRHDSCGISAARHAALVAGQLSMNSRTNCDAKSYAWLVLGNSLRIAGNLRCAGRTLSAGEHYRQLGTRDPALRLMSLQFRASLAIAARRLGEAAKLLKLAEREAHIYGLGLQETSARIKQAIVAVYRGEPAEAFRRIEAALGAGEWSLELRQSAHEVAITALALDDQPAKAYRLWEMSQPLYAECGDLMRLKVRWAAGLIAGLLGRCDLLAAVQEDYLSRQMGYEAALVSLDLATCAARQGDRERTLACLAEAEPVLAAYGLEAGSATASSIRSLRYALMATCPTVEQRDSRRLRAAGSRRTG